MNEGGTTRPDNMVSYRYLKDTQSSDSRKFAIREHSRENSKESREGLIKTIPAAKKLLQSPATAENEMNTQNGGITTAIR